MDTTMRTEILTHHVLTPDIHVTRFRTRHGKVVWMVTDERLISRHDHGGIYQGDRAGAVKRLRELLG